MDYWRHCGFPSSTSDLCSTARPVVKEQKEKVRMAEEKTAFGWIFQERSLMRKGKILLLRVNHITSQRT